MQKMQELGCDRLVTGHYARIRQDKKTGRYRLLRARAHDKDQSYVLYTLGQEQLARTWFPMGEMPSKAEVRDLARSLGLHLADKPDSQEICFVSEAGGYSEFLRKQRPDIFKPGKLVDREGKELGDHEGVSDFTVGQRRGLGISARRPLYVIDIQPDRNRVVVGEEDELLRSEVPLEDLHWSPSADPIAEEPIEVEAKIRYNMEPERAVLHGGERPRLVFRKPVRAVTPGQIAVAYRGKTVLAGGTIRR